MDFFITCFESVPKGKLPMRFRPVMYYLDGISSYFYYLKYLYTFPNMDKDSLDHHT